MGKEMREKLKIYGIFEDIRKNHIFPIGDRLHESKVSPLQNQLIKICYQTVFANKIENLEARVWGGNLNPEKLHTWSESIETAIKDRNLDEKQNENLKKILDEYKILLNEKIALTFALQIPVRNLPVPRLLFYGNPQIIPNKKGKSRFQLEKYGFIIAGEILGLVPSAQIIYKTNKQKTLGISHIITKDDAEFNITFSPVDLEPSIPKKKPVALTDFDYFDQILRNLDSQIPSIMNTRDSSSERNLAKTVNSREYSYALNQDYKIMKHADTLVPLIRDSKGFKLHAHPIGLILPQPEIKRTLIVIYNKKPIAYTPLYQALYTLCHIGASCYEFPYTKLFIPKSGRKSPYISVEVQPTDPNEPIQYWNEKELTEFAFKRGIVNLPKWTEKELENLAMSRGLIELEEWTEEELLHLKHKRLVPDFEPEPWIAPKGMVSCKKCGYGLLPRWKSCPVCDTPVSSPRLNAESSKNAKKKQDPENAEYWQPPKK